MIGQPRDPNDRPTVIKQKVKGKTIWVDQQTGKQVTQFTPDTIFLNENGTIDVAATHQNSRGTPPTSATETSKTNEKFQGGEKSSKTNNTKSSPVTSLMDEKALTTQGSQLPSLDYNRFPAPTTNAFMGPMADLDYNRFSRDNPKTDTEDPKTDTGSIKTAGADVNLKNSYGPETVGPASKDITDAVRAAVADVLGPGYTVNATSGERHGGSGNHSASRGAMDFGVFDPNGNRVTDKETMVALGAALGKQGFQSLGYGKGYMGPGMMHAGAMAAAKTGAHGWGANGRGINKDEDVYNAFMAEKVDPFYNGTGILPSTVSALPTDKPGGYNSSMMAQNVGVPDAVNTNMAFETVDITPGMPDPSRDPKGDKSSRPAFTAVSLDNLSNDRLKGVDFATMTPAQAAALGFTERDNEDDANIGFTLAGELLPDQLAALASGDPKARQEFANMIATVENRAAMDRFADKPLSAVLNTTDYQSLRPGEDLENTKNHFSNYQEVIMGAIGDYRSGKLAPSSWDVTHYHNGKVKPGWDDDLMNVNYTGLVNGHKFGSLMQTPYDGIGKAFSSWRDHMVAGKTQTDWNNTPSRGLISGFETNRDQTGGFSATNLGGTPQTSESSGSQFGGQSFSPQTSGREGPSQSTGSPQSSGGSQFSGGQSVTGGQSIGGSPQGGGQQQGGFMGNGGGYNSVDQPENNNAFGGPR